MGGATYENGVAGDGLGLWGKITQFDHVKFEGPLRCPGTDAKKVIGYVGLELWIGNIN